MIGDTDTDPHTMENHSDRPEIVRALSGEIGIITRYSQTLHEPMMYLASPLMEGGRCIGIIRTTDSISAIDWVALMTSHNIDFITLYLVFECYLWFFSTPSRSWVVISCNPT